MKTALGEKKLARIAKRMLLRYDKAVLKASMHAAPHGYGDGFSECMCRRCERALWYQEAASEARAVWIRYVRRGSGVPACERGSGTS